MVTITERKMQIPPNEKRIGCMGDNKTETRQFELTDPRLFDFHFKLDIQANDYFDTVDLEKTTENGQIFLTWEISQLHLSHVLVVVQLRAFSDQDEKWHSEKGEFWAMDSLIMPKELSASPLPTEFEQIEQRITQAQSETLAAWSMIQSQLPQLEAYAETTSSSAAAVLQKSAEVAEDAQSTAIYAETVLQKTTEAVAAASTAETSATETTSYALSAEQSAQNAAQSEQNAAEHVTYMETMLSNVKDSTVKKYGARRVRGASSPSLERIWDAKGLSAATGTDSETVQNAFDSIYPWSHIRTCNIKIVSGEIVVTAYEGEPSFTRDGTNGNVAVEVPKFYLCPPNLDSTYEYWGISEFAIGGWYLAPDFIGANGQVLDKVYYSAYPAAVKDGKLISVSGTFPEASRTRAAFRSLARETDSRCSLTGLSYHHILSTLFTVEFATLHSQSIMNGASLMLYNGTSLTVIGEASTNRVVISTANAASLTLGQTIGIATWLGGNNIATNRVVTAIEAYDTSNSSVSFSGDAIQTKTGYYIYTLPWKNGITDQVAASSGAYLSKTSGKHPCNYRGIENPWGNIMQWIDGINITDYQSWICDTPDNYTDDLFGAPYKALDFTNASIEGYVKTTGYDSRYPWARIPTEIGGSSATYYSDNYYVQSGKRALSLGGFYRFGAACGLWCFYALPASTTTDISIGARLCWK